MKYRDPSNQPKYLVLDVDGVLTDGKFYYSEQGKILKAFSVDDHDALKVLQNYIKIVVITADSLGYEITKKRIQGDMKMELTLVSTRERKKWISENFNLSKTIYMGDGIFDPLIFKEVMYSIAPNNALKQTRSKASFVTKSKGGDRAVAEACLHVLEKFFGVKSKDLYDLYSTQQS